MKIMTNSLKRMVGLVVCMLTILGVNSCKFDDTELWDSISGLEERIKTLEEASKAMQTNINGIHETIAKLQEKISVESITKIGDNTFDITFSDGSAVHIINNIKDILPPSVVVLEENGQYYWGYKYTDGKTEFLLDKAGEKILIAEHAPQVRINPENNHWEISTDEGTSWTDTNVDAAGNGEKLIEEITEDENFFYLQLANGGQIQIAKSKELSISISAEGPQRISYGNSKSYSCKMTGVNKVTIAKPDGWRVKLVEKLLTVTAPAEENIFAEKEGMITLIAFGADGQSEMAELPVSTGTPVRVQIQWTQGEKFFTDIHIGSAEEAGAEDLKPANTFLVRPGKTYRFKTNVMGRGTEGVTAMGLQEESNSLGGYTIRKDASIDEILNNPKYEYIYFTTYNEGTAQRGGNAVISVMEEEKVLWTWMIWARDEDPKIETIGTCQQMAVNLGSWGDEDINVRVGNSVMKFPFTYWFGLPYSWGFHVPQPGLTNFDLAARIGGVLDSELYYMYYYDVNNQPVEVNKRRGSVTRGLGNALQHPEDLIDLTNRGADLYAEMWGATSKEKTIFDPCPYGYRVAGQDLYNAFEFSRPGHGGITYANGVRLGNRLNLGGYLGINEETKLPSIKEDKKCGYYWTDSSVLTPGQGDLFSITSATEKGMKSFERKNGAYVRCVKYEKEM